MNPIYQNQMLQTLAEKFARDARFSGSSNVQALSAEVSAIAQLSDAFMKLSSKVDSNSSSAVTARAQAAGKVASKFSAIQGMIDELQSTGLAELTAKIQEKTGLKPGPYDAEIRQVIRQMPEAERIKALQAAIDNGDTETVSALLLAPSAVTGISSELAAKYRAEHIQKCAPRENKARQELIDFAKDALTAVSAARNLAGEFMRPELIAQAKASEERTAAALADFEVSINPMPMAA